MVVVSPAGAVTALRSSAAVILVKVLANDTADIGPKVDPLTLLVVLG